MKHIYGLFIIIIIATNTVFAQQDFGLYNMDYIPQVQYTNPSTMPKMEWYYNGWLIPFPSNFDVSTSNSGFKFSKVFPKNSKDSVDFNVDNFINGLGKKNYITASANIELLNFGFRARESYVSFAINFKNFGRLTYPGDIFKLVQEGNGQSFLGERANIDGLGVDAFSYLEFSTNYARNINDKLTIGLRPKLLFGLANIYTESSEFGITTAPASGLYDITLDGKMQVYTSGLDTLTGNDDLVDQLFYSKDKNWGAAIDLGATYKFDDKLSASIALNDIGFIKWKNATVAFQSQDLNFEFSGVDLVESYLLGDSTTADPFGVLSDSVSEFSDFEEERGVTYSTPIPGRLYLSAKYMLAEQTSVSVLSRSTFIHGRLSQALSFGFNHRVKKWLGVSTNISAFNRKYFNWGLGFSVNLGPFQFYAISDNILPLFGGWATIDGTSVYSYREKNMHLRGGFNMIFGRKEKDADGDKIVDKKDKCPNVFGLEEFEGCPDTDQDGIKDSEDNCPTDFGLAEYQGCPDTDLDGIIDKDDECPSIPGIAEMGGCPDADGDGIKDSEDKCPQIAGVIENKGCPLVQLSIINMEKDTLFVANKNEDNLFVFRNIDPLQDYDFLLKGEDTIVSKHLMVIILQEDEAMRMRTNQDSVNPKLFHYICPKVQAYDENGDLVGTTIRDKDGTYRFTNLDPDHSYTFLAIGDEQRVPSDLKIIVFNEDGIVEMIPNKDEDNYKKFQYIPLKKDDKVILSLLGENGDVILTSEMDKNGMFIFKNLDPDQTYSFKLDGDDPRLKDELQIMYMTEDGVELISAKRQEQGTYMYRKLNQEEEENFKVNLTAEEKRVVDEAFTNLEFESSLTIIKEHSLLSLGELAKLLIKNEKWRIHISGHTDNVGDDEANMRLSERRAKSVSLYLASKGVSASKFIIEWFGETRPKVSNDTPEERQQNRRVEMEIVMLR